MAHDIYPDSHVIHAIHVFLLTFSRLWSVGSRSLQNETVIKRFRKNPKSSKFHSIKSRLQFMHNLYPFCRHSKISRNSSHRLWWNFSQQAHKLTALLYFVQISRSRSPQLSPCHNRAQIRGTQREYNSKPLKHSVV